MTKHAQSERRRQAALTDLYRWLIVCVGALAVLHAAWHVRPERLDLGLVVLVVLAALTSLHLAIPVPRFDTNITVSDTFIFLALLLYGEEPAVLLGAAEGIFAGLRASKSKRPVTILFNAAAVACAVAATGHALRAIFGEPVNLPNERWPVMATAIGTMALVQYATHTWLVAIGLAIKTKQPIWRAWHRNYLWSSITYFVGAATAGAIVWLNATVGLYALAVALPTIVILYFTYANYLEDIRATAAQAELAERRRAEQAEQHVRELSRYIAELEQTTRALEESREHFRYVAFHDVLTGLPNRALFAEHVQLAIERARRHADQTFAVLFIDLDRFKYINDCLGHAVGDKLLVATARRLESCVRQVDTVARFGGDEFAILLDRLTSANEAVGVAERIQEALSVPFQLDRYEAFVTASIGIAFGRDGEYVAPDEIIRDADIAMYRAKESGRARYELFDKEMHSRAVSRLRLENDLRRALAKQEFCLHYQPIINLHTGKLAGFEALARWQHPERGLVSPVEFIPVAEETGLIVPIGRWMMQEACHQMSAWHRQSPGNRHLTLSVNLSGKQLAQPDLTDQIEAILNEAGLPARALKLEITETVVMENAESATAAFDRLRKMGVRLSIDDFGTGYSSLGYLHRFPFDTLKIDRSFIGSIGQSDENLEIVHTITKLAHNLGMDVVAEGVERAEQVAVLRSLSCHYGQGFFFSKPLDSDAATQFIELASSDERKPFVPLPPASEDADGVDVPFIM